MYNMFKNSQFNQNISKWDLSNLEHNEYEVFDNLENDEYLKYKLMMTI